MSTSSSASQQQTANAGLVGSSASSIKLVQQQVQGFIQGLNNEELTKLMEIFEKALISPGSVVKSCKMVQYKCYESKIDLNGKVGCGFGRSEEDAVAISIKDFFEILLQEEKYLYLVKECFRQMRGQTQAQNGPIPTQPNQTPSSSSQNATNQNQLNTSSSQQQQQPQNQKNLSKKQSDSESESSATERKRPQKVENQIVQEDDENEQQESNPSDINTDYQIVDNQMSMIEMQINESNVYELSKKIGNISMINGPNVVASTNFNNNSQQDIDEMLLKIMFEEEKKFQQQQQQHNSTQQQQQGQLGNPQEMNFNQYLNNLQTSQQPMTQFQIYQMQYLQQQQQQGQQQQPHHFGKQQGPQQQLQQLQQHFSQQSTQQQRSYFQSYANTIQQNSGNNNINNSNNYNNIGNTEVNNVNNVDKEDDNAEVNFDNVSTPPSKNKRISMSNNSRAQLQQINQQLNDTAFMPIKNNNGNTSNQVNPSKLIRNSSSTNNSHQSSQQQQSTHFSSQQQQTSNNFGLNSVQAGSTNNLNTQNSFNVYANKENSYQQQQINSNSNSNNINSNNNNNNNNNSMQNGGFGQCNKINNFVNGSNNQSNNNFNQTQPTSGLNSNTNHGGSKTNLHLQSTNSTCCTHKEELDREKNKVDNLEKKIKLLMEENKILKSLLLDNQAGSTSQNLKSKLSSNQTPRGYQNQTNPTNVVGNSAGNSHQQSSQTSQQQSQQEQTDHKYLNNNNVNYNNGSNNNQNTSNSKNPYRNCNSQMNMRSQSQDPTSKYQNHGNSSNNGNQIMTYTQYSSGHKKNNMNTSDSKNNYLYGSTGKYANDDLNCSHLSLNNSSQLNQSSVKKAIPKLNLEVLPNYHGKFHKSQNNKLLNDYNSKYGQKKRY